ncbi:MAG: hypothetical protein ACLP6E_19820 [Acidimicrobiales bacterium]
MQTSGCLETEKTGASTWRRRIACYALGIVAIAGCLTAVTPLAAGALQPARTGADRSFGGITGYGSSGIVAYKKGFATVANDQAGDILLFHRATNATTWAKTEIYSAADDGVGMYAPVLATSGKSFAIVAKDDSNKNLFSWVGNLTSGFTAQLVSDTASYPGLSPSIAYSPVGHNYVLTDTDNSGNIDYWYSTTASGGWQEETVAYGADLGTFYDQSVVTVTDAGVVIVGTDGANYLNAFYQPIGSPQWSMSNEQFAGFYDLSIASSGSEIYLAFVYANGVFVLGYSDVGVPNDETILVYQSSTYPLGDYIAWSGSNAVLVSKDSSGNLDFFYSNSNVSAFFQETIATDTSTLTYGGQPAVVVGHNLVVVTDATRKGKLYAWLQPVGGSGWTQQLIGK